jgi:DNA-binding transcriptional LysR family regulator
MQNWDDLKFCLALERYQTMTAAARAVGTNTATVSRRIDRLTEEAGEPLFLRDNTQWRATDMGRELAQIALRIEDRISRAATETMEQQRSDVERITCSKHRKFFRKLSQLEFDTQLSPSKPRLW